MGNQVFFSCWHSDIGIPINFHEESGMITIWSTELNVILEVSRIWATCPNDAGMYVFLSVLHNGFIHRFIWCDERWEGIPATVGKSDLLSRQGISVSTLLEAVNSGFLSHTYCWGKHTLEVLVECWPTSSIEFYESALFWRWYGIHGAFLDFLCWNWCSSRFKTGISGNLCICVK